MKIVKEKQMKKSKFSIEKENTWKEKLDTIFDIAHTNANELITIEEDGDFLKLQREGRK